MILSAQVSKLACPVLLGQWPRQTKLRACARAHDELPPKTTKPSKLWGSYMCVDALLFATIVGNASAREVAFEYGSGR